MQTSAYSPDAAALRKSLSKRSELLYQVVKNYAPGSHLSLSPCPDIYHPYTSTDDLRLCGLQRCVCVSVGPVGVGIYAWRRLLALWSWSKPNACVWDVFMALCWDSMLFTYCDLLILSTENSSFDFVFF